MTNTKTPTVPEPDDKLLWTYSEVAQKTGVSEMTIRREVDRGNLKRVTIGNGGRAPVRFRPDDVIIWINSYTEIKEG